jgi:putative MATE family efflux protein
MSIQLSDHFTCGKLLKFSLPSILMMVFTSIYSIVDGFFVSNFAGDIPFKAVNLIFPFIMIMATVGFMFGTGGTALVASVYGAGDKERANRYFSLFVYVAFGLGVVCAVISFLFMEPIAAALGAEGAILRDCVTYGRILMCSLPFCVLQYLFQNFCVAAEKPRLGLIAILAAGIANMVLDAILVTLLPLEYKLVGAAIATAFSQFLGGVIPLIYFFRKNSSILQLGKTRFELKALGKACSNGASEFMSNIAMNLVGMLYNIQLLAFAGDDGVAAYGVMMYVSFIFSAVFFGYVIGVSPIISFHHGAGNHTEKRSVLRKSLLIISSLSVIMLVLGQLLAVPLTNLFVGYRPELAEMTIHGFRIFALSFMPMGFAIFASSFFTALNDGLTSALISFLRTLIFQLGAVLLLPMIWQLDGIWISVVVAEVMAVIFSAIFLLAKRKKFQY